MHHAGVCGPLWRRCSSSHSESEQPPDFLGFHSILFPLLWCDLMFCYQDVTQSRFTCISPHTMSLTLCPRASLRVWPVVHAVHDERARGSVRGLRQKDRGPLLPAGRGQTVAHALPQVLRVQTQPGVWAHLLQQGRQHLLQGGLLQVGGRTGPGAPLSTVQCVRDKPVFRIFKWQH